MLNIRIVRSKQIHITDFMHVVATIPLGYWCKTIWRLSPPNIQIEPESPIKKDIQAFFVANFSAENVIDNQAKRLLITWASDIIYCYNTFRGFCIVMRYSNGVRVYTVNPLRGTIVNNDYDGIYYGPLLCDFNFMQIESFSNLFLQIIIIILCSSTARQTLLSVHLRLFSSYWKPLCAIQFN